MYRKELAADSGMLFVYKKERKVSMWMKNTYLPLDMFFIKSDGTITKIVKNTKPMSLDTIPSDEPVSYVLELNAGVAEKKGISSGSIVWGKYFQHGEFKGKCTSK